MTYVNMRPSCFKDVHSHPYIHTWHAVSLIVKGCIATAAFCLWGLGMSQRRRARDVSDLGNFRRRRRARDAVPVNEAEVVDVEPQEGPLTLLEMFQWPQMALCRLCGLFQAVGAAVSAGIQCQPVSGYQSLPRVVKAVWHRRWPIGWESGGKKMRIGHNLLLFTT